MEIYMKKITLTLMLLALVGSSSDLCAAQAAQSETKRSMMSRMYSAASGAASGAARVAGKGMSSAAEVAGKMGGAAAAKVKSMRNNS
jgi:hypothetical protein